MASLQILSPVAPWRIVERPLAERLVDVGNARIGLLDNQKANAGRLLEGLGRELTRRHCHLTLVVEHKSATSASSLEVMTRLRTYDAVVLAIAD